MIPVEIHLLCLKVKFLSFQNTEHLNQQGAFKYYAFQKSRNRNYTFHIGGGFVLWNYPTKGNRVSFFSVAFLCAVARIIRYSLGEVQLGLVFSVPMLCYFLRKFLLFL